MEKNTERKNDYYLSGDGATYDTRLSKYELGKRAVRPLTNGSILQERFCWAVKPYILRENCFIVEENGTELGIIPRLPINILWKKAHLCIKNGNSNVDFGLSKNEFDDNINKMTVFLESKNKSSKIEKKESLLLQELWTITETEIEELFLPKASKTCKLLAAAVREDIAESLRAIKNWKKIKYYAFKLPLEKDAGGIFSAKDADILKASGIRKLNDICKLNVYDLKNMFLEHSIESIPKEINAAYKEDWERRKDKSFKIIPFIFEAISLIPVVVFCYKYQYSLLYNTNMTLLIIGALIVWAAVFSTSLYGAVRAVRRRKTKRPGYRFFTRPVLAAFLVLAACSLFAIGSASVFYERYDGYDDTFYYRELENEQVAVAGLRDESVTNLVVPQSFENKTVSEIDILAFCRDELEYIYIPDTVNYIDKGAFIGCEALSKIRMSKNVREVEAWQFAFCNGITDLSFLPEATESVGNSAFRNCNGLITVEIPNNVVTIGDKAFKNCYSVKEIDIYGAVEGIGKSAFADCAACEIINCSDTTYLDKIEDKLFYNCQRLTETNLIENATYIGNEVFGKCGSIESVAVNKNAEHIGKKVFYGCDKLKELTVPFLGKNAEKPGTYKYLYDKNTPVASLIITGSCEIKANALKNNRSLQFVTLSEGVASVGKGAFENCEYLVAVSLPSGLTKLNKSTFSGCASMVSVKNIESINSFGEAAFRNCGKLFLENGYSLQNAENIEKNAFYGCNSLGTLELASVNNIGKSAFENCIGLTDVVLGEGFNELSDKAFASCYALSTVKCLENLKVIGKEAFNGCRSMTGFSFGEEIEKIGAKAFMDCDSVISLNLPKSVIRIGKKAFAECDSLTSATMPFIGKTRKIWGYWYIFGNRAKVASVEITDMEKIHTFTFLGGDNITKVKLNEGATSIGWKAFDDLSAVKDISLPASVSKLDKGAFKGLKSLVSINIPDAITEIGKNVFKDCTSLTSVYGCNNVVKIGDGAFENCTSLTDISISSVKTIGKSGFAYCTSLKEFPSADGLETIGEKAFKGTLFTSVKLGSEINALGKSAFEDCYNLTEIELPEGLNEIGDYAFSGCTRLENIDLSLTNVKTPGKYAFKGCYVMKTLTLRSDADKIPEGMAYGCLGLTNFVFPSEISSIGDKAFQACGGLEALNLPSSLTKIGKEAFMNCSALTELNIPASVEIIYKNAFTGCSGLKKVVTPFVGKRANNFITGYKYIFGNNQNITEINITGMKKIYAGTLKECSYVKVLELSDVTVKASKNAFKDCLSLTTVSLPSSMESAANSFPSECKVTVRGRA